MLPDPDLLNLHWLRKFLFEKNNQYWLYIVIHCNLEWNYPYKWIKQAVSDASQAIMLRGVYKAHIEVARWHNERHTNVTQSDFIVARTIEIKTNFLALTCNLNQTAKLVKVFAFFGNE